MKNKFESVKVLLGKETGCYFDDVIYFSIIKSIFL